MTVGPDWAGNHTSRAGRLHRPTTLEQVQQVVAAAPRIRVLGSRHSFTDSADSAELLSLEAVHPFAPRPHRGRVFAAGAADLAPLYERHADFVGLAERLDPRGAATTGWNGTSSVG